MTDLERVINSLIELRDANKDAAERSSSPTYKSWSYGGAQGLQCAIEYLTALLRENAG